MEWKLDRIRDRCGRCQAVFGHEQVVISAVLVDDAEKALRIDVCAACLPTLERGAVWWETRFQTLAPKKKKVDFDRLLRIFEAWQTRRPKDSDALLYLITLLLVRKRFLRMVDLVSEEGAEYLRLRKPGPTEQWYLAPAPLLQPADLLPLRSKLEELIDGTFEEEELPKSTDAVTVAGA